MEIFRQQLDGVSVTLNNPEGLNRLESIISLATNLGGSAEKVCLVKTASKAGDRGFKKIETAKFYKAGAEDIFSVYADGVILTGHGSSVIFQTADCPVVVIYERMQNRVVAVHAGKPATTPDNETGSQISNIITTAFAAAINGKEENDIRVLITGSICGNCFPHDTKEAQKQIAPFDQFGKHAFVDREAGKLDLVAIIKKQLIGLGVREDKIVHDDICTLESRLVSYRRNKTPLRNFTVITLH